MFGPQDFLAYLKHQSRWPDFPIPAGVILFYQRWFLNSLVERELQSDHLLSQPLPDSLLSFHLIDRQGITLGLSGGFGIGSPAAAAVMEELIAIGVSKFISIGTAGSLQQDLPIGSLVLCERAIRDEGVSHHYLKPAKYAHPSASLTKRLQSELVKQGLAARLGTTWTLDTPYRETLKELQHYQAQGVLTVEMEAAALSCVAQYRGVEFAAAFVISDSLASLVWEPQFRSSLVVQGLDQLYDAAVASLL